MKIKDKGWESIFSFFAATDQQHYTSPFVVFGQNNKDSCVAACVRMWLNDAGIETSESHIVAA